MRTFLEFCRGAALALSVHISRLRYWYAVLCLAIALIGTGLYALYAPADGFYPGLETGLHVAPGTSVREEAALLHDSHLIRSKLLFRILYRLMPGTHGVQAGDYEFAKPVGEFTIAWNLSHGVTSTVAVTLPEGWTARQMGAALKKAEPGFDEVAFDALATPHEGYLFPDTYYVSVTLTPAYAVDMLMRNFNEHLGPHAEEIRASKHSERDVIIMASLLEGEGKTLADRRIIAGILWHRLAIGMPLQVDAPFAYVKGVPGYAPTTDDLKSSSPYNTYTHTGLPPTPINNPGDESITAALTPTATDYLYYLTGTDGQMHYAKTFVEHIANQKAYLK